MKKYTTMHLIKSEDLNHHGTMFAGRMAEWFVEACFIAAADTVNSPKSIVCLQIHGLNFGSPAYRGDLLGMEATLVKAGKTSLTVYGTAFRQNNAQAKVVEGFITFVYVDEDGAKLPHGIVLDETNDPDELQLRERALKL